MAITNNNTMQLQPQLHLKINHQTLSVTCDIGAVVSDSIAYLSYDTEYSPDWEEGWIGNNIYSNIIVTYGEDSYVCPGAGPATIPWEVIQAPGFTISAVKVQTDIALPQVSADNLQKTADPQIIKRITTQPVQITISPSGTLEGTESLPSKPTNWDVILQELIQQGNNAVNIATEAKKIANEAKTTATSADGNATTALNTANTAKTTSDEAIKLANDATKVYIGAEEPPKDYDFRINPHGQVLEIPDKTSDLENDSDFVATSKMQEYTGNNFSSAITRCAEGRVVKIQNTNKVQKNLTANVYTKNLISIPNNTIFSVKTRYYDLSTPLSIDQDITISLQTTFSKSTKIIAYFDMGSAATSYYLSAKAGEYVSRTLKAGTFSAPVKRVAIGFEEGPEEITISQVMLNYGTEILPYSPHVSPIEMNSSHLIVQGKNLLNIEEMRNSNNYDTSLASAGFWFYEIDVIPNIDISLSRATGQKIANGSYLMLSNNNKYQQPSMWLNHPSQLPCQQATLKASDNHGKVYVGVSATMSDINILLDEVGYLQLEYNDVTEYQEYIPPSSVQIIDASSAFVNNLASDMTVYSDKEGLFFSLCYNIDTEQYVNDCINNLAIAAMPDMTQPIGINTEGKLVVKASKDAEYETAIDIIIDETTTGKNVIEVESSIDLKKKREYFFCIKLIPEAEATTSTALWVWDSADMMIYDGASLQTSALNTPLYGSSYLRKSNVTTDGLKQILTSYTCQNLTKYITLNSKTHPNSYFTMTDNTKNPNVISFILQNNTFGKGTMIQLLVR